MHEGCITINTERHYRWRAVDQERNTQAAKQCVRQLRKGCQDVPGGLITEKRTSDGAAKRAILPGVEHRQHRSRNHRAEHSHHPP
jgi:putative transposase